MEHSIGSRDSKGKYVFYWGGWDGASEGRVISQFFYKLGRLKPVLFATGGGGVTVFLGKEKIYPCRLVDSCLLTNTRSV